MKINARFKFGNNISLHLMLLVPVIIVFIYHYIPLFGVIMAFERYIPSKGFFGSPWIGWGNFKYIFSMPNFYPVLWNTFIIAFSKIIYGIIVPVTFALLLNEVKKTYLKRTIQTLIYLPHFLSWVILGGVLIDVLSPTNGLVNDVIKFFGVEPIFFLGDNHWFRTTIVVSHIWKEFGWGTIIYLAALTGVDPTLYEAAILDGANRWKQTLNVSIPGIITVIVMVAILNIGGILNAGFDQVLLLYNVAVYETGDILDTLVYRMGLGDFQFSVATAIGLFKSVISFALLALSYRVADKYAGYKIF